jgi:hypothetical protein
MDAYNCKVKAVSKRKATRIVNRKQIVFVGWSAVVDQY